ncbi:PREDICTED: B3 domain-containing protein REM5-like [Fragaria vesca subsp. vesca]|uniref:B3 domain-containing protein REM5-like n=1 Tax=Fragaria vesca subsp. vesca TaxID=101020 RepID=UPI0002C31801|nr:PREDICTED: B3 domain-containing protein REM5-like [Fragaria vesca subsp. vesca]
MARKIQRSARRPAFFKGLKDDFSRQLRIPSAFIKKLNTSSPHRLRGPSGEYWDVELGKRGNQMFFHRGWEKFVQHHPVEVGDLLIFSYDGVSMFNVRIYGKTFCEKNVKAAKSSSESNGNGNAAKRSDKLRRRRYGHAEKRRGVDDEEEIFIPFQSENPFVYRTLGTNSLYEVHVPREVIRKEGYRVGMTLEIKDVFGISWKATVGGSPEAGRMLIRSGLPNICRANQASPGDTVIFEFVKPGVVQLHVIKAGAYKQPRIIK